MSLADLKSKLAALEVETASHHKIAKIDHSPSYRKKADGFQYNDDDDYSYDTVTYGRIPDPQPAHEPPPQYTQLIFKDPALLRAEIAALEEDCLGEEESAQLAASWSTLRDGMDHRAERLRQQLLRCNVEYRRPVETHIPEPDEHSILSVEKPLEWRTATDDPEAYSKKLESLDLFAQLQRTRYKAAVTKEQRLRLEAMRQTSRRLDHDLAEASSVYEAIEATLRLMEFIEKKRENSREAERSILHLHRVCEADENQKPTNVSGMLKAPPVSREEIRAKNLGYDHPAQVLPFDRRTDELLKRRDAALNPARPMDDMGSCQRTWMALRNEADAVLEQIHQCDAQRGQRQHEAESRYDRVRQRRAETWITEAR